METGTILIIDDYLPLREVVAIMLRDEGYEVMEADNGQTALDMLLNSEGQNCPSCIVLDVKMPIMNGNEFLYRLEKEKEELRNIPVIVYSADGEMGYHEQIKARLEKPVSIELLLSAIKGNMH
jgi:CheY-like chemotaxis protein